MREYGKIRHLPQPKVDGDLKSTLQFVLIERGVVTKFLDKELPRIDQKTY